MILVDCDGVLSNLIGSVLALAREQAQIYMLEDEVLDYDYGKATGWNRWDVAVETATLHREFVYRMQPYHGAKRFLEALEARYGKANVLVCTKPWPGLPDWINQRSAWLRDCMGVETDRQIHCSRKDLVSGFLIDDSAENLECRDDGFCIARPWNQNCAVQRGDYAACLKALR
jgi:5'(3')-deoxyribonucleotidase